jgi:hypothetical protein
VGFSIGISLKIKIYPPGNWQKDIEIQSFNFGKTMLSCWRAYHWMNSAANYRRHIPGIEIGNWVVLFILVFRWPANSLHKFVRGAFKPLSEVAYAG